MEQNRSTKVVAIIALLVGVLGLSVGFSAYSKVLNIQNVQATVTGASSNFNVKFSTASDKASTGSVTGSGTGGSGSAATLEDTTISNLTASFTGAGSITYTFYVRNDGKIPAYLTSVGYGSKDCNGSNDATGSLVALACDDILVTVKVGEKSYPSKGQQSKDTAGLAVGAHERVDVIISNDGTHAVDGNFTATISSIKLNYSTQPPA